MHVVIGLDECIPKKHLEGFGEGWPLKFDCREEHVLIAEAGVEAIVAVLARHFVVEEAPVPDPLSLALAFRHQDPPHRAGMVEVDPPLALAVTAFGVSSVGSLRVLERIVVAVGELAAGRLSPAAIGLPKASGAQSLGLWVGNRLCSLAPLQVDNLQVICVV